MVAEIATVVGTVAILASIIMSTVTQGATRSAQLRWQQRKAEIAKAKTGENSSFPASASGALESGGP